MFNRRERVALLFLTGALLVGTIVSAVDSRRPELMEDFRVIPAAVPAPLRPESPATALQTEAPGGGELVDVNSAAAAELQSLPHIGPATAARILEYRREHGAFHTLDDLRKVTGIGPRTVDRLRTRAVALPSP